MGSILSRNNDRVEEINSNISSCYSYPPKSGFYFGDHFFMGGKKFDTAKPEGYLFGDNSDLNYLGPQPHNLTYQLPEGNVPIRALKCLVNIRKDSLRLVRAPNCLGKPQDDVQNSDDDQNISINPTYNIEFTFDADSPCSITIYYNASEEISNKAVIFTTASANDKSDSIHFTSGCNQQFCLPSHVIDPSLLYKEEPKLWNPSYIPITIQVCAKCGPGFSGHSHITYACFDKGSDNTWNIKVIKQKQVINGVSYLFQEIYGIENKAKKEQSSHDNPDFDDNDEDDDDNFDCVVCLSEMKDTLILPCKHLCLCSTCANQLRFQQSGCPICRQPFRALLQIRAVKKSSPLSNSNLTQDIQDGNGPPNNSQEGSTQQENDQSPPEVSIPPGYEVIPLMDAINGPVTSTNFNSFSSEVTGGDTRTGSILSNNSSLSSFMRRSKRKKKSKVNVDVENEVASSLDGDGNFGIIRKKSSRRKKKARELEISKDSSLSNPLHVYVNDEAVAEEGADKPDDLVNKKADDLRVGADGDHTVYSTKADEAPIEDSSALNMITSGDNLMISSNEGIEKDFENLSCSEPPNTVSLNDIHSERV